MCDSVLKSEHLSATPGQVVHTRVLVLLQVLNMQRVMGVGEYHEEWTSPAMIALELGSQHFPAALGQVVHTSLTQCSVCRC